MTAYHRPRAKSREVHAQTHLFDNPRHGLPLMHLPAVPLRPHGRIEARLVLRHTGIRIRQIFRQKLLCPFLGALADDDIVPAEIFALGSLDARCLDEEFGVGFAFFQAFAGPCALCVLALHCIRHRSQAI